MADRYRAAVIGCGKRGAMHARAFHKDPRCEVVALTDVNTEAAEAVAREHDLDVPIFTSYEEMLQQVQPDVAGVALWTGLHHPVFMDCVQAGVRAVMCEKPMAPTWGEALEMAELAERENVQLTFCHQRRFNPGVQLARQLLNDGTFGEIIRMELFSPRNLLDCGVHTIDFAFMFNRETPAAWVMGQLHPGQMGTSFGIPREDMATGFFHFQNGVRCSLEVGGELQMVTGGRILCTDGILEVTWGGDFPRAIVFSDPDWTPPEVDSDVDTVALTVKDNIDCLESGQEPEVSYQKSLRANEVVFAMYESCRLRRRIDLPLQTRESALLAMVDSGDLAPTE